ncbi:MAG: hypothetical protein KGN16_20455 [Burkholderiales bacterium]|nr:hypothetical protein [Burkholderiales bacterium]
MKHPIAFTIACAALLAGGVGTACADPHDRGPAHEQGRPQNRAPAHEQRAARPDFRGDVHFDNRYHHDHYYPARGAVFGALPGGAIGIGFGADRWFFHGGVWFRPYGGRYIVGLPPYGIIVPILPPDCSTLWIAGIAYYYANGIYYTTAPGGYTVVAPPAGADAAQPVAPAPVAPSAAPAPIFYPRSGQSPEQTETDRQDCNRWATTQPGAIADASVMQRAVAACMDARGYTVR